MDRKMKQTWDLIWGNKQYRKIFGLHPVFIVIYLLSGVVCGMLPLFFRLAGEEFRVADYFMAGFVPAFLYLILFVNFGTQFQIMLAAGKSLCSLPMAKQVLTGGILLTRFISLGLTLLPTVLLPELWVLTGVCEKSMTDDILLMFGIAYLITALAAGVTFVGAIFGIFIGVFSVYNAIEKPFHAINTSGWLDRLYAYEMPWWLVTMIMIFLITAGTVFGGMVLDRAYEKRRVVIPLNQRVAQR